MPFHDGKSDRTDGTENGPFGMSVEPFDRVSVPGARNVINGDVRCIPRDEIVNELVRRIHFFPFGIINGQEASRESDRGRIVQCSEPVLPLLTKEDAVWTDDWPSIGFDLEHEIELSWRPIDQFIGHVGTQEHEQWLDLEPKGKVDHLLHKCWVFVDLFYESCVPDLHGQLEMFEWHRDSVNMHGLFFVMIDESKKVRHA